MKELLYRKIAARISDDILGGRLSPGMRLPGVRELAAEWNTSSNTVLKALSLLEAGGFVKKKQGQGIFVESGDKWSRDYGAEIDLLVYDMNAPFNLMLVKAIEKAATDYGYRLTVKSGIGPEAFGELKSGAGRIIIPESAPAEFTGAGENPSCAVVCIGEFNPPHDFRCSYAVADTYGGFYRAAGLLLEAGRERIAYIGASSDIEEDPGWNACRDVLAGTRHGFRREYAVTAGGWNAEMGRSAMEEILASDEYPDGLICANDILAAGAMKACLQAGLSIPGDIAVIGAGDQDIAPLLEPPLASLRFPAPIMGLTAVSYIDSLLSGRAGEAGEPDGQKLRARFDLELRLRESVPSAVEHGTEEDELRWL